MQNQIGIVNLPGDDEYLKFNASLHAYWSVESMELQGTEVFIRGLSFPVTPGRLVCLIEDSSLGQRISQPVELEDRSLRCPIQTFSSSAQVRLRDLASGATSKTYTLTHETDPTLVSVVP